MPESVWKTIKEKTKREWVLCFCAALFWGLTAHICKLTNFIPNWDSILNLYSDQDTTYLGRCFLKYACGISLYYDLPWINGCLSLLYISLSAVCICQLFRIKKRIPLVFLGAFLSTFPTVTSTLAYNYTADGYFLAMLCMCGAVLLLAQCRYGVLPAVLLLTFGMGCYQAYIVFALVLSLVYFLDWLLFGEFSWDRLIKEGLRFAGSFLASAVLYWVSLKGILSLSSEKLSSYQSISQAFVFQRVNPVHSIKNCVIAFGRYFWDFSGGVSLFSVVNVLTAVTLVLCLLLTVYFRNLYRDIGRAALLVLFLAAVPFACYALYFISPDMDYHNLMVMGNCMIYVLLLLFYERLQNIPKKILFVKQWVILLLSLCLTYVFVLTANISYQKLHMAYERSYGVLVRIADRIEQMPEALGCQKIAVIGSLAGSEPYSVVLPPDMTGITDGFIIRKQDITMRENVLQAMLKDYAGLDYQNTTAAEIEQVMESEVFAEMAAWPKQGSIAVWEDILVIRLGETKE